MVDPHKSDVVPITPNHVSGHITFEFKLIQFVSLLSSMLTNIIYHQKKNVDKHWMLGKHCMLTNLVCACSNYVLLMYWCAGSKAIIQAP